MASKSSYRKKSHRASRKRSSKRLKEQEFYCVAERKRVKIPKDDIGVKKFKNRSRKGGVPALVGYSKRLGCKVIKFVKSKDYKRLEKKYGKF